MAGRGYAWGGGGLSPDDKAKLDNIVSPIKSNLSASSAPTVTDDSDKGYAAGSVWIFQGVTYTCTNATVGSAVWASNADIFYFDTWADAETALSNASNGNTYLNKFIQIANGNGGHNAGTYTKGTTTLAPITDGNPVVYRCTTAAGATYSITLQQRPAPPFRVTAIYNVSGAARPTADGYYIFTAPPASGYPIGTQNDILQLKSSVWTVHQTYSAAPTTIQVGATSTTTRAVDKALGGWSSVVSTDDMTTTAELVAAVNAAGAPVVVVSNRTVSLTATAGTFTPEVIFQNPERLTFTAASAVALTFSGRLTMRGSATFTRVNIVANGERSLIEGVAFSACRLTLGGFRSAVHDCAFTPGASYADTALITISAGWCRVTNCAFDVGSNTLNSLYVISRTSTKIDALIVDGNILSGTGTVRAFVGETSTTTQQWNGSKIINNQSYCGYADGFISTLADVDKWNWIVEANQCEHYGSVSISGSAHCWLNGKKMGGVAITGNVIANCPGTFVKLNNTSGAAITGNTVTGINARNISTQNIVLANGDSRAITIAGNTFFCAAVSNTMSNFFLMSGCKSVSISGNTVIYESGTQPSGPWFVQGDSTCDCVAITGNNLRFVGGSVTIGGWSGGSLTNVISGNNTYSNNA